MRKFVLFLTLVAFFSANIAGLKVKGGKKPVTDQETLNNLTQTAGELLRKLDCQGKLELVELQSATYQTVAGSKYEILAKVKENGVPVDCTITQWEKPWIADFLKFDVECGDKKWQYSYANGPESEPLWHRHPSSAGSGLVDMSDDALNAFIPKITRIVGHMEDNDPEFNYTLKRVVSGVHESLGYAGQHTIVQIEVTPIDHADQIKECQANHYEGSGQVQVNFMCENDNKRYSYDNTQD